MAVTVYRSDDTGAPTLTIADGDLVALLDAVLVNGYDVKPAAGWTKEFSGTNQAVYRNSAANGGSGTFFQIDDSTATTGFTAGFQSSARIKGGSNCTGFDAFTEQFPTASTYDVVHKGYVVSSNTTYVQPWIIIADEHTVIMIMSGENNTNNIAINSLHKMIPFSFGDFSRWDSAQQSKAFIAATTQSYAYSSVFIQPYYALAQKTQDGTYPCGAGNKYLRGATQALSYAYQYRYPVKPGGKHVIQGLSLDDPSVTDQRLGHYRGLAYVRTLDCLDLSTGDTFTEDGRTYILVKTYTSATVPAFMAFETSDTWEPV